ncbi:MAG: UDP-N-acetylglucosamine diphosphorylase [Parachlamydiales bacterium]|nr:UDP-N-acetylglucosamine diphosphorylase [Parachlamydiales bacterium]
MNNFATAYFFDIQDFEHKNLFENCQYVWESLNQLTDYLKQPLGKIEGTISPDAYLINPDLISIGSGTVVEAGAYIKGPCIIGKNCEIRHGAYIRGGVVTGDHCVIGHDTEIKNTILLNHVAAAHFAYLGDSILGNNVNLGAGVKCANLKLNHQNIILRTDSGRWPTGKRKLGLIAGDRCQIGCNAVSNPGTLMGPDTFCYPGLNFGGFYPAHSVLSPSCKVVVRTKSQP